MYAEIAILIILIILIMWVGVREGPSFYVTNEIYPQLKPINPALQDEVKSTELNWINHPENDCPTIVLCELTKWTTKYPRITEILAPIKKLKAITVRITKYDTIKKQQGWADISNHTLRNIVLLEGKCELQVSKQSQQLKQGEWATFDSSKPHVVKGNCTVLIVDLERPEKIITGKSKLPMPDNLLDLL